MNATAQSTAATAASELAQAGTSPLIHTQKAPLLSSEIMGPQDLTAFPPPEYANDETVSWDKLRHVVNIPRKISETNQRETFEALQDWEGLVETIETDMFTARLRDRTRDERIASETVQLPICDVSADDLELLRPGAIFYLTIGRVTHVNGRVQRMSRIVFRRLPAWTQSILNRAQSRAHRLHKFLTAHD